MSTTVPAGAKPRILLIEDHQIFAELLAEALQASGLTVVGISNSLVDALDLIASDRPDVVVLDHDLPHGTGANAVAEIRSMGPRVLMLTASTESAVVHRAITGGCDGFVTKRQSLSSVIDAVKAVLAGENPLSPDITGSLLGLAPATAGSDLTPREREVLELVSNGLSNKQIAGRLFLSTNTVRNHVQHVLEKLDAHSKLEAVAIASRRGLLAGRDSAHR